MVAALVDGVAAPVQYGQSPPDGHHRGPCADWHREQICWASGGSPDSALRPNASVRGANRMPHAAITLPRLIVPRCVSWSSVDRRSSSLDMLQDLLDQRDDVGLRELHPGCAQAV